MRNIHFISTLKTHHCIWVFLFFAAIPKLGVTQSQPALSPVNISGAVYDSAVNYYSIRDSVVNYLTNTTDTNQYQLNQLGNFVHFWDRRMTDANGGDYTSIVNALKSYAATVSYPIFDEAQWELLGPVTVDNHTGMDNQRIGSISEVLGNPDDDSDILIGTTHSGIWKYQAITDSWYCVTDNLGIPCLGITSLVRHKFHPDTIYASTGATDNASSYGIGIIVSYDGGVNWSQLNSFNNALYPFVTRMIIDNFDDDPTNESTLYALAGKYIFHSSNSGQTWGWPSSPVPQLGTHSYFNDLAITTNGDLIVTTANVYSNTAKCYLFNSTTTTWSEIQLYNGASQFKFKHARVAANVNGDSTVHEVILVADRIENSGYQRLVFLSEDTGLTWNVHKTINGQGNLGTSDYHQELCFVRGMNGRHNILVGSDQFAYMSSVGPQPALNQVDVGHLGVNDIEFVKYDANYVVHLLVATNGGISKVVADLGFTPSGPPSVQNLNGLYMPIANLVGMGVSQSREIKVVAGSRHNETFIYEKNKWTNIRTENQADGGDCEISPENPDIYFYQKNADMIMDDGQNTSVLYPSGGWNDIGLQYELNPEYPGILYAGQEGSNGIGLFNEYNYTGSVPYTIPRTNNLGLEQVGAMASDGNGLILAAARNYKPHSPAQVVLIKSTDNGNTWTDISGGAVSYQGGNTNPYPPLYSEASWKTIDDIAIDPDNSNIIFLALSGLFRDHQTGIPIPDSRRVLRSIDGGLTWFDFSEGLGVLPCHTLAIQKTDNYKRIFVGNEVGVFYRDITSIPTFTPWQPFQEGLPVCIVTDLDIRECTNELYAATNGRGVFRTSLEEFPEPDIVISNGQSILWDADDKVSSDVIIKNGGALTIEDCQIEMLFGRKIIVEQGGRLVVDNATLTNYNFCDTLWEGVEVWGWDYAPQALINGSYIQGYMEMKNDAVIENARYGVRLWNPQDNTQTGGILIANNSRFHNCWQAIEAWHYENWNPNTGIPISNATEVDSCGFIVDDLFPLHTFESQIKLYDVWGLRFKGCEFEDQRTNITDYHHLGKGMYSLDASYEVGGLCTANPPVYPCTGGNLIPSSFAGFAKAIHAEGTNGNRNIEVTQTDFERNITGIRIDAVDFLVALNNNFSVGDPNGFALMYTGIKSMSSKAYRIEENSFSGVQVLDQKRYGVYIYNSGPDNNQVYKNTFTAMDYAQYSTSINRHHINTFEGLQYLCNEHYNTTGIDIYSNRVQGQQDHLHGIRDYQGYVTSSAANHFTPYSTEPEHSITNKSQNVIKYFYNNIDPSEEPVEYTPLKVILSQKAGAYNACPSYSSGGYNGAALSESLLGNAKQNLALSESAYLNLLYNYNQLIDGGSTNALLAEIQLSWPEDAWELRNELLSNSPYLSEEVIRQAGEKGILPSAMMLEICLANPEAVRSEELMDFLGNEIPNPLPAYMLDLIRACWEDETARTVLEATLAGYGSTMMFWSNVLIADMMQADELQPVDTLLDYLNRRQTLPSVYSRIEALMADSNYTAAQLLMELIPQQYELNEAEASAYEHFVDWFDFRQGLHSEGRGLTELNEEELDGLQELASHYDRSGEQVRNLLCFLYGICIELELGDPESQPKSSAASPYRDKDLEAVTMEVFPNPAHTYLTCRIAREHIQGQAVLKLSDVSGRVVYQAGLKSLPGDHLIDTRGFPDGTYVLHLQDATGILESTKLMIRH